MSLPKSSISGGVSWFWGIVLSIALHGFIFLLVLYWGFGNSHYSAQPDFIEGRLVSLSHLSETGVINPPPRIDKKIQQVQQKEEIVKEEKPKEEPQKIEKENEPRPEPEKKEPKKEEPKREIEEEKKVEE